MAEKYEEQGNQDLIPKDPIERFKMREFVNRFGKLISSFYAYIGWNKKSPEEKEALLKKSEEILDELNESIQLPYALGENFTMADILIYPWYQRWPAVETFINSKRGKEWKKLEEWEKNIQSRPAVKKSSMPLEFYV